MLFKMANVWDLVVSYLAGPIAGPALVSIFVLTPASAMRTGYDFGFLWLAGWSFKWICHDKVVLLRLLFGRIFGLLRGWPKKNPLLLANRQ